MTPRRAPGPALEWLLAGLVLASVVHVIWFTRAHGYVPMPLFPDPTDTYGDGYNTTWWAHNGDMYAIWGSIYPPFAFAVARLFSDGRCYDADAGYVRDCDWVFWGSMIGFGIASSLVAFAAFRRQDRATALPRALVLAFGLPMLFLYDRMNLLLVAYVGLFAGVAPLLRSARLRWLGLAVAINLKPYMIAVLGAQLLQRRWRAVEGTLLLTLFVALLAWIWIRAGSPAEIWRNIAEFSSDPNRAASWPFIFYASSYDSLVQFLRSTFPLMPIVGSKPLELWPDILVAAMRTTQLVTVATCIGIWWHPGRVTRMRTFTLCYTLAILSVEPGGYAMGGTIFGAFFERWRGAARVAIVCAYLLSITWDVNWAYLGSFFGESYRAKGQVYFESWVTIGPFLRPGMVLVLQLALCWATLRDLFSSRSVNQVAPQPAHVSPRPL